MTSLEEVGTLQIPDAVTNAIANSGGQSKLHISTEMNYLLGFERFSAELTLCF